MFELVSTFLMNTLSAVCKQLYADGIPDQLSDLSCAALLPDSNSGTYSSV